jgi:probable phosphoglycerate mutase
MLTQVWILRHGLSTFNLERRFQGSSDEPQLTPEGRRESRLAGEAIRSLGIGRILCSPLQRALQTVEELLTVFGKARQVPIQIDNRLRELDLPEWEGLTFSKVEESLPRQFHCWRQFPHALRMRLASGQEVFPVQSLYERVREFWQDIQQSFRGESFLLVTHSGTSRALISTAMGLDTNYFHRFQKSNSGLSLLAFPENSGAGVLELLNSTDHLGASLPKLKNGKTGTRLLLIPATEEAGACNALIKEVLERTEVHWVLAEQSLGWFSPGSACSALKQNLLPFLSEEIIECQLREIVQKRSNGALSTGVIAACPAILRRVLRGLLNLSDSAVRSLTLQANSMTVVHYPGDETYASLQTLNLFQEKESMAGARL